MCRPFGPTAPGTVKTGQGKNGVVKEELHLTAMVQGLLGGSPDQHHSCGSNTSKQGPDLPLERMSSRALDPVFGIYISGIL